MMQFKRVKYISIYRQPKKVRIFLQFAVFVGLLLLAVVSASQLQVVRDFFSSATGEPANITIDTTAILGPMPRPWRNLAQGGESHDWRMTPIVEQVRSLNPEYIRIDHIYDFHDIVGGTSGNLTFNFSKLDLILDDILATGAKPYIALSYMPPVIASGDIISAPTNYADWQNVVQKTIEHVSGTRGISDVYYEVWNEPDLFGGWKYYGEKNYLHLYSAAARGAQNARGVQPFKIGGPAITALYKNWFDALAKHVIANNLRFDFFSWHRYSNNLEQYQKDMTEIRTWMADYPQLEATTELHITEWGHDSENDAGYDTSYSAAHTAAGAIEMIGVVERAFVFEIQDGKDPAGSVLWGRWGMFTHNDFGGQPKPRYWGLRMLESLDGQRVQLLGKGTWVKAAATRDLENNIDVVLANFDTRGRNAEAVPITFTNIDPGSYAITKRLLSGQSTTEQTATDAAVLRTFFYLPANSVGHVELSRTQ